ncbi:MAG: hypothetical protein Q7S22_05170 [Candidatus Micrarchaeota archaeon]|nr:hypothetical protein [Candidatus Micrarchaeota archaeon]
MTTRTKAKPAKLREQIRSPPTLAVIAEPIVSKERATIDVTKGAVTTRITLTSEEVLTAWSPKRDIKLKLLHVSSVGVFIHVEGKLDQTVILEGHRMASVEGITLRLISFSKTDSRGKA